MTDDAELLRRYSESRSDAAFTELVERNFKMVYFTALRRTNGNVQLAEDVAQEVFGNLAKNPLSASRHPVVVGWLYLATRNAAANMMRAEQRRKAREQQAGAIQDSSLPAGPDADWDRLRPEIDAVMDQLSERERNAVLLRCLQDRPFAEIGRMLRISDEAARKRVDRSLDKLRGLLIRRGIASTSAALAIALATQAGLAAPPSLPPIVAGRALRAASTTSFAATTLLTHMSVNKVTIGLSLLIAVAAGGLLREHHTNVELRQQIAAQRQLTQVPASENERKDKTSDAVQWNPVENRLDVAGSKRAEAAPSRNRGLVPAKDWKYRGTATAADALESYLWAVDRVDVDATAKTIAFGKYKPKVDAYFSGLPQDIQAKYATPEQLWAEVLTGSPHDSPVTAFNVLSEVPDPSPTGNYASLDVQVTKANGRTEEGTMIFEQTPDGWRRALPLTLIAPMANFLPSATVPPGTK